MTLIVFFSLIVLLDNVESKIIATNDGPIVTTNVGTIRGVRADDGDYNMFMGIPYATVNQSNVFGNSIPFTTFYDIFDANDDSARCPQIEEFNFTTVGSLDCLHLNVYVPDTATPQNLLPVMVYIYGGSFLIGFAGRYMYGPQYLVRHDVILVTINYRLGPYGFMCLGTPEVPGNQGLKDQVTALRWIKNNIQSFGGDPDKVTLFGNSVGATSNGYHLISETEKLFTNIVMQSGSAFSSMLLSTEDIEMPQKIAAVLEFQTSDTNKALDFLSTADVYSVIEASSQFRFGVCLEKKFTGVERFVSQYAIYANHTKVEGVPILHGFNSEESLPIFPDAGNSDTWETWRSMFIDNLINNFDVNEGKLEELERIVKRFYIGDKEINGEVRQDMMEFSGDFAFVYPTIRSMATFLKANSGNIYQYLFSYDGGRNFVKRKDNITLPGVAHADEIGYLFNMGFIPEEPSPDDQLIIDRMTTMWTNFAKYGDPTPETTSLLPVKWHPITRDSPYHYLEINTGMSANQRYEPQRMSFWDLFYKAYGKYEKVYFNEEDDETEESTEEPPEEVPGSSSSVYLSPILGFYLVIKSLLSVH